MPSTTNLDVLSSFAYRAHATIYSGHLKYMDHRIYSYAEEIGRWIGGTAYIRNATARPGGRFLSMTTSRHVNTLEWQCARIGAKWKELNEREYLALLDAHRLTNIATATYIKEQRPNASS